jgi:hypothetical protein
MVFIADIDLTSVPTPQSADFPHLAPNVVDWFDIITDTSEVLGIAHNMLIVVALP